jgi:hypothetical protein
MGKGKGKKQNVQECKIYMIKVLDIIERIYQNMFRLGI